ncbi:RagB/SusD family nutrient uptake outer membrane protein [Roseimarinus sediminis]|uniref:RagB/SusD family nutrient uptake outer membrane protein n=1 Tax=Roseimarinus sediminis TaxID=1610899 RepID=UPI003D1B7506
MNTRNIKIYVLVVFATLFAMTSCLNDLNTIPLDDDVTTSATVYDNPEAYRQVLAKVYAGLATTGQEGPAGIPDVGGIDEGFSSYLRGYWNLQELPTEEAVTGWGDDGLVDLHAQVWTSNNDFVKGFYYRVFYQIAIANEFIRESSDEKLNERGVNDAQKSEIQTYRAEARFLRALSYWHALDMFGNVPFITENDPVGSFLPEQIEAGALFEYIEGELLEIESLMAEPMTNEYGRADRAAAWMLLSKLYLNAEVYLDEAHYTEAAEYAQKVIDAGYELDPVYGNLFLADNHTAQGIIFAVPFDGVHTKTWGATTFIINGAIGGSMDPADFGVQENWGGHRTTSAFVQKFPQYADAGKSVVVPMKSTAAYPVLYVPGSYQGWDAANTSTVVYSRESNNQYEGYIYINEDGAQFKFDSFGDWSLNYGDSGADGTLDQDGDNIVAGDAGLYKLNVDLDAMTYSMVRTDWGIIGDATEGGWDSDQNMTLNADGSLTAEVKLAAGSMKFRANDEWTINYGDTGADGLLELDGENIAISEPGKYTVTLILNAADYTYGMEKASSDERAMFHTDGQSIEIDLMSDFTNGYAVTKWKNLTSDGVAGSDPVHADTDYPMFRIADAYLTFAEAVLRGGGDKNLAVEYVNKVRTRAYTDESGNITAGELTLDFILDERARELYWESHRRTDLVRYKLLTGGDYIWPWKGGVKEGKATDAKYRVFPIPASDIIANPNLEPTSGY